MVVPVTTCTRRTYAVSSTLRHHALPAGETTGMRGEPFTWKTPGSEVAVATPPPCHSLSDLSAVAGKHHSRPLEVVA